MEKKENLLVVLVIILSILVISLSSYLIYDKVSNMGNTDDKLLSDNDDSLLNNDEAEQYDNNDSVWFEYLKGRDIIIKKSVWDYEKDDCQYENISMTKEMVNNIIDELSLKKVTKYYYFNPPVGAICSDNFRLEYDEQRIDINSNVFWINDETLSEKLDLGVDNIIYDDNADGNNYVYKFEANFMDILNKYIQ